MVAVGGKRKIFSATTSSDVIPKRLLKEQKTVVKQKPRQKKKRAHLMREWLFQRRRHSDQHRLVKENALSESEFYFRFIRMSPSRFEHLLSLVGTKLLQKRTSIQDLMAVGIDHTSLADRFFLERMSPAERLTITLRFLATGEPRDALSYSLGISEAVIGDIVSDTCMNLWEVLSGRYVQPPKTCDDWIEISDQFYLITDVVHCLGAIDGKQIALEVPSNSISLYHDYEKYYNLLMISACDAHYCFTLVDIGSHGNNEDDILDKSEMGSRFESRKMSVPPPEELEGCPMNELPYFLVGDEAFPLKDWLMKPYPGSISRSQKIFNCRISRAQRFIENSLGILAARWRIYQQAIKGTVEDAQKYTLATVGLHNYLMMTDAASYCPRGFVDSSSSNGTMVSGMWRDVVSQDGNESGLRPVPNTSLLSRLDTCAMSQREALCSYFLKEEAANFKREQTERARYSLPTAADDVMSARLHSFSVS